MATGGAPFDALSSLDPDTFTGESRAVISFLADYYRDVETYRSSPGPASCLRALLPDAPPENGEPMEHRRVRRRDALHRAQHCTLHAGRLAGRNRARSAPWWTGWASWRASRTVSSSPAAAAACCRSTCEAVVCTLAAARSRAEQARRRGHPEAGGLRLGPEPLHVPEGREDRGIPRSNFRVIPTTAASGYSLTADSVRDAVEADVANRLVPLYLCATVGTTRLSAVDPVRDLGELARNHGMWLHVDAAYAGSALICPEFQHHIDGVELAESVSMNPHSGSSPTWTAAACAGVVDYKDWQIALSRPFRAMKLWVVLRRYGGAGMRAYVRRHVEMARWFEQALEADGRFGGSSDEVLPRDLPPPSKARRRR
ncbi:hypothetical protein ZWY2020_047030 [Hordeum vulgare]|nr:hypothetical protein ZWY2020_047030 [Hordeum vulgare]